MFYCNLLSLVCKIEKYFWYSGNFASLVLYLFLFSVLFIFLSSTMLLPKVILVAKRGSWIVWIVCQLTNYASFLYVYKTVT